MDRGTTRHRFSRRKPNTGPRHKTAFATTFRPRFCWRDAPNTCTANLFDRLSRPPTAAGCGLCGSCAAQSRRSTRSGCLLPRAHDCASLLTRYGALVCRRSWSRVAARRSAISRSSPAVTQRQSGSVCNPLPAARIRRYRLAGESAVAKLQKGQRCCCINLTGSLVTK